MKGLLPFYLFFFSWGVAGGTIAPVFPLYIRSLGVSVVEWGVMISAYALGMMIFEPIWGFLSDRMESGFLIVAPTFIAALLIPLYTIKVLLPFFLLLQFLKGALLIMSSPTGRALISESAPSRDLGAAMGLWYASRLAGAMMGSLLGSCVAAMFSFEYSFYLFSLISLGTGIFGFLRLRGRLGMDSGTKRRREKSVFPRLEGLKGLVSNTSVLILFLLAMVALMGREINSFIPIYASEVLQASTFEVGVINAVFNGVCVVVTPILGMVSDRVGRKLVIEMGLALSGATFLGYAFTTNLYQLLLVVAATAVGFSLLLPSLLAFLTDLVSSGAYGAAMGLFGSCENIGIIVGPLALGAMWVAYSPRYAFYTMAAIQLLGGVAALRLSGPLRLRG